MANYSDISIDQGSSFSSTILVDDTNGLPCDLTDFQARGQIRRSYSSLTAIDFITTINNPTSGQVGISLPASVTRLMKPGRYVFDVEIYNLNDDVTRISEGQVTVSPASTKVAILSTISTLDDLQINAGTFTPVFYKDTLSYTATFLNTVSSITITPFVTDTTATLTVNALPVINMFSSSDIKLLPGTNSIPIIITAQDGISQTVYNLIYTKI